MAKLSNEELIRYSRHLNLPDFGLEAQQRLKAARVLVIGTGGLGAPVLQYLTAAGVGHLGVMDMDVVDTSNLQRQVLFDHADVGQPKTTVAIRKLTAQNPLVRFEEHQQQLTSSNAMDILAQYDLIVDGTDNFPTRYLVNDACVLLNKPYVYGSVYQYEGQVSVFNWEHQGVKGPNYRDLHPDPPPPGLVPNCAEGGVLGVLPGIIGSIQANEALKLLTGVGEPLSGRLLLVDTLHFSTRIINIPTDPNNPLTGTQPSIQTLIDFEAFCGTKKENTIPSVTVHELAHWIQEKDPHQLVDVREPHEYAAGHLEALSIPLGAVIERQAELDRKIPVILYCKSGTRSAQAMEQLRQLGFTNLYNLEGGILAWQRLVDNTLIVV